MSVSLQTVCRNIAGGLAASLILGGVLSAASTWGPGVPIEKDLVYGRAGDVELKMDLARPTEGTGPFPAVVWIHGGGWRMGTRTWGHGPIQLLAWQGYVAITITYRFAPQFPWPAQIHDAKAAVRYLRAHAKELNIDPERIGVMGESSGGHMALMVGLTGPDDGLEGDSGSPGFSSRVQAVVSYCTLTDFTQLKPRVATTEAEKAQTQALSTTVTDFGGTKDPKDPVWARLSPVTYADKNDPPVLMFQGSADPIVPEAQAHILDEVMTRAGTPHRLFVASGGGHEWKGELREETNRQMLEFFRQHLKPKQSP